MEGKGHRAMEDTQEPRTCRCGHPRDHFWVSPEAQYSGLTFYLGLFMGLSGGNPRSIRFRCRKCGDVVEESTDPRVISTYREA